LAVASSRRHDDVPHDLKEMEGQLLELGEWMTLTVMTMDAAGDRDRGTMASE
jgi:hypothetical protein